MKAIRLSFEIKAPIYKVWKALVDPEMIEKWSGEHAIMSDRRGMLFRLFGGNVFGKNIDVQPFKCLVQEFYGGEWDSPSLVTFALQKLGDKNTRLDLRQEDIPEGEFKSCESGWEKHYMKALIAYVER